MVSPWSDSKFPQVFRTLLSILADLNNAVVWLDSTCTLISKSFNPVVHFLSMWLSGIMAIMNSKGDRASPWKIPPGIFVSAKLFPPAVNSTLQFFMVFSIKFMTSCDILYYYYYYFTHCEFFPPMFAGGLLQEWQPVSSGPQDSFEYFSRSLQSEIVMVIYLMTSQHESSPTL